MHICRGAREHTRETHTRSHEAHTRAHIYFFFFFSFFFFKRKKKEHANNDFLPPSLSLQYVPQLVTNYLFTADVLK